jgi:hypothetical protein
MEHLETNNILVNFQHGFRKGHSCESQLINTIESLARSLDQNAEVIIYEQVLWILATTCGTPDVTGTGVDSSPSTMTVCVRDVNHFPIQFKVFPFIP